MLARYVLILLVLFGTIVETVSAVDAICRFNGSVDINKSDLPAYFSDQVGCGLQNTSDSSAALMIGTFLIFLLIFIYGVFGKR